MGGVDHAPPARRRRIRGDDYIRAEDVRRDVATVMACLFARLDMAGDNLMSDERPMIQRIADDYGVRWPDDK